MVRELSTYARLLIENNYNINALKHESLNKSKAKTGVREFAEIKLRLSCLSKDELGLLAESDFSNQKLIAYLSCCRAIRNVSITRKLRIWQIAQRQR